MKMTKKGNNRNFGLFNSLFRYAPQRIEQSKNYLQKVVIHYCEKLAICNCEKLTILNLLFTSVLPESIFLQLFRSKANI